MKQFSGVSFIILTNLVMIGLCFLRSSIEIRRTPDDIALINIYELAILTCSLARETTEILHMYFNGASSKGMAFIYLICLDIEGNAREILQ